MRLTIEIEQEDDGRFIYVLGTNYTRTLRRDASDRTSLKSQDTRRFA